MRPDQNTIRRVGVGVGEGRGVAALGSEGKKKRLVMIVLCASRVKKPHYTNLFSLVRSQDAISGLQRSPGPAEQKSLGGPKITASSSSFSSSSPSVVSVLQ